MANLQDVAKSSGVSIASVSRILNNDPAFSVADATRKKVIKVADELGYRVGARHTKKKNSTLSKKQYRIGIVQMYPYHQLIEDPYYFHIESSLEQIAPAYNMVFSKIINHQDGTFSKSEEIDIDGIFAIGIYNSAEIERLKMICPTIVFIDSSPNDAEFSSVVPNFYLAVEQSIRYFLEAGHTKIGFIGERFTLGGRYNRVLEPRLVYFESIMKPMNLFNEEYIIEAKTNVTSGYEETKKFFDEHKQQDLPTAFFISSDSTASGVLRAAFEAGLKVPEDISIITFNNTILSECALVPLTSVAVHIDEMAVIAIRNMQQNLLGEAFTTRTVISCHIVKRHSVQKIKE